MYERLKFFRDRHGIPQNELAETIGLSKYSYNQYENEQVTIPIKHLIKACDELKISLDYVFGFTDIKRYDKETNGIDLPKAGIRLREFRKEHKLTQVKLAELLGTIHQTITKYENGKNIISTTYLYAISKKYGVSADYLLGKIDFIPEWCKK